MTFWAREGRPCWIGWRRPRRAGRSRRPGRRTDLAHGRMRRWSNAPMPAYSQFSRAQNPFPNALKPARCRKTGPCQQALEEPMRTIGHFIGAREIRARPGRTADVYEPMTGDVQAKVDLASKA